jgi:ABC-type transporter Mla subunit MlaD
MDTGYLLIGLLAVNAIAVGALVPTILELRRTSAQTTKFIGEMEQQLGATLKEAEETLRSIRAVTDDVGAVTGSARRLTESVSDTVLHVQHAAQGIDRTLLRAGSEVSALRAGIMAGLGALITNLLTRHSPKGDTRHE